MTTHLEDAKHYLSLGPQPGHMHLALMHLVAALEETQLSSPAIAPMVVDPSGSGIGYLTYSLVRAEVPGELRITAMDTSAGRSLIQTLGRELNYWLPGHTTWTLHLLTTSESPSPSGATPSATPEAAADGPPAGGPEAGDA